MNEQDIFTITYDPSIADVSRYEAELRATEAAERAERAKMALYAGFTAIEAAGHHMKLTGQIIGAHLLDGIVRVSDDIHGTDNRSWLRHYINLE